MASQYSASDLMEKLEGVQPLAAVNGNAPVIAATRARLGLTDATPGPSPANKIETARNVFNSGGFQALISSTDPTLEIQKPPMGAPKLS